MSNARETYLRILLRVCVAIKQNNMFAQVGHKTVTEFSALNNERCSNIQAVPRPTSKGGRFRKWDSGSAKSRDSGYLGDSMSGLAAHQMYHNEDQENAAVIR